MTLIVTLDDRNGMLFHKRRLSRDSVLCQHILEICDGADLWMNSYSATIFPESASNIRISEKFLQEAGDNDFCFAENTDLSGVLSRMSKLIVYRWNRSYPSDVKFPEEYLKSKELVSTLEFSGSSHPCITQEVYQ